MAFQRQNAKQLIKWIADVGALGGTGSGWDPEQSHEAHHMVDAQRPGMAHVRPQRRDEWREPGLREMRGNNRWEAPVLTSQAEIVRRGANASAEGVQILVGPRFRPTAIDRHCQIAVQPNA